MVIDSNGKMFEERRKKEIRKNGENIDQDKKQQENRKCKDRRDPKNAYRP